MNNFLKIFFLVLTSLFLVNCTKTDDGIPTPEVPRDFGTQYADDNTAIVTFLKTHSITFDSSFNVTAYHMVASLNAESIWGTDDLIPKTNVEVRYIIANGVSYKVYYLKLNQGSGDFPCNADEIQISYAGAQLSDLISAPDVIKTFEAKDKATFPILLGTISGWSEILPQFNCATTSSSTNYGAGVMFIPSGFAYFNVARTGQKYATLVYSFKLINVVHTDYDGDGILSINEGAAGDRYVSLVNTDGDAFPDFNDPDDDNDNVLTAFEIKRPKVLINGILVDNGSYPFSGAAIDDLLTPYVNESQGVPDCSGDFISPTRKPKYLDKNCK